MFETGKSLSAISKFNSVIEKNQPIYIIELDFGPAPDILKEEYLDMYEGIQSEILNTTRFDENSDLSTTYVGKSDKCKNGKIKWRNLFPYESKGTP